MAQSREDATWHAVNASQNALSGKKPNFVTVKVKSLEIAKGHDGFVRGEPEPVLLAAAFEFEEQDAVLLGRVHKVFSATSGFPSFAEFAEPELLAFRKTEGRLALLSLAFEEDSGSDIRDVYATLEDASAWQFWVDDDHEPSPQCVWDANIGGKVQIGRRTKRLDCGHSDHCELGTLPRRCLVCHAAGADRGPTSE